jgi:mannose-1-phosphate guanylyltransferase/mannose-6-phosphate isomerase
MAVKIRALLLAGGAGTRLWPLSTEERPKQFLRLAGERSLLQSAYERVRPICDEEVFVATSEKYGDLTLAELRTMSSDKLLLEPARRNTAPAILVAALRFERDGNDVLAVVPADQAVSDEDEFRRTLLRGAEVAGAEDALVTLGVAPTRPETEYGYLEVEPDPSRGDLFRVSRFVEKPDRDRARSYIDRGNVFWNAGVFLFRPSALIEEAGRVCPDLLAGCRRYDARWRERDEEGSRAAYEALASISIDYAVFEKAARVACVVCRSGWSDLGSFRAIAELRGRDDRGNLILSDRPVVAAGVSDTVIAVTSAGAVVFPFDAEAELRLAIDRRKA